MVSTRQMATSCSGGGNGGVTGGATNSISHTSYTEDSNSLRPSVVTRQSNAVSVVNTMPSLSSALVLASTPTAKTTTPETASSTSCARQTQAFKSYGGGSHTHSLTTGCNQQHKSNINLLDLPEELLTNILSYVGYKKIAQLRVVSAEIK